MKVSFVARVLLECVGVDSWRHLFSVHVPNLTMNDMGIMPPVGEGRHLCYCGVQRTDG